MRSAVGPALAALAIFAACVFGLSPSAYWLDSAELVTAAHELGIPHPPGHPVYALTAKPIALLPLGSIPWRVNVASAAALAAAASLLAGLFARVARRVFGWESAAREPLGAGVAVAVCLSYAAAFQGVRAEVYALHLLCAVTVLVLLVRFGEADGDAPAGDTAAGPHPRCVPDGRFLWLAALVSGLGLANHHFLMVLGGAPLGLYGLWRAGPGRRARLLGGALAALVLGLGAYAYLPVRASRAPVAGWGDPVKAERLGWVVSARAFQKSLRPRTESTLADNTLTLAGLTMEALTPLGPPLGLVGLWLLARRRRALGLALGAATALTLASQLPMPADPHNPDVHGYLLFALALLGGGAYWLVAALGAGLRGRGGRVFTALGLLAALALPLLQGAGTASRWSLAGFQAAEEVTRPLLRELPTGAVALTSYFQTLFLAWHGRVVEGERPDVALVHRHFLRYPGYAEREGDRHRDLADLLAGYARQGRFEPAALAAVALERPVWVEWDLDLQPELRARYRPHGWLGNLEVLAAAAPPVAPVPSSPAVTPGGEELRRLRARFWARRYAEAGADLTEPETRRYFLWKHFLEASAAHGRGMSALAAEEARRGLALAPESAELRGLLPAPPGTGRARRR